MRWFRTSFNYNTALFAFGMFCGVITNMNISFIDILLLLVGPALFHITQHLCERRKRA